MNLLAMNEEEHAVGVARDGMRIDLGGIGKGYALDQVKIILEDWSIGRALVHGGESTVLALGPPEGEEGCAWLSECAVARRRGRDDPP